MTASQDQLVTVKFWHAVGGLYIWEYLVTLDYEWKVIRGHLPYRWTIWIYSLARLGALMSVILCFVTMDVTTRINCELWVLLSVIPLCLSSTTASLLIVLRTIAIWNRNKVVMALAIIVWLITVGSHLHNIAVIRSVWISPQLGCVPAENTSNSSAFTYVLTTFSDITLLLIILTGVLVLRRSISGLARVVWKQGITWLVIAFVVEIPLLVFTMMHSNDPLHNLFVRPGHIILTIATTRMHRHLVEVASESSVVAHESSPVSNLEFSKTKPRDTLSIALDRIEIATHVTFEQHLTGRSSDDDPFAITSTKSTYPSPTVSPSLGIVPQAPTQCVTV